MYHLTGNLFNKTIQVLPRKPHQHPFSNQTKATNMIEPTELIWATDFFSRSVHIFTVLKFPNLIFPARKQ